jgi:nitroimidazol reductase NimA-like FMN-containing flavoprotein (pyridoxamine 5'-phosphate oxidase superfamily)
MPSREGNKPVFSMLRADECEAVLARNHVGRLAFMNASRVDIEPVSYVATGSWLFMRSAEGTKLEALAHNPYVAFEVDEISGPFDWRSVVARGTIYLMADDERYVDQETVERAVQALRSFQPQALRDEDPTPFRRTVYGLHVDLLTGRMAEERHPSSAAPHAPVTPRRSSRRRRPDGF